MLNECLRGTTRSHPHHPQSPTTATTSRGASPGEGGDGGGGGGDGQGGLWALLDRAGVEGARISVSILQQKQQQRQQQPDGHCGNSNDSTITPLPSSSSSTSSSPDTVKEDRLLRDDTVDNNNNNNNDYRSNTSCQGQGLAPGLALVLAHPYGDIHVLLLCLKASTLLLARSFSPPSSSSPPHHPHPHRTVPSTPPPPIYALCTLLRQGVTSIFALESQRCELARAVRRYDRVHIDNNVHTTTTPNPPTYSSSSSSSSTSPTQPPDDVTFTFRCDVFNCSAATIPYFPIHSIAQTNPKNGPGTSPGPSPGPSPSPCAVTTPAESTIPDPSAAASALLSLHKRLNEVRWWVWAVLRLLHLRLPRCDGVNARDDWAEFVAAGGADVLCVILTSSHTHFLIRPVPCRASTLSFMDDTKGDNLLMQTATGGGGDHGSAVGELGCVDGYEPTIATTASSHRAHNAALIGADVLTADLAPISVAAARLLQRLVCSSGVYAHTFATPDGIDMIARAMWLVALAARPSLRKRHPLSQPQQQPQTQEQQQQQQHSKRWGEETPQEKQRPVAGGDDKRDGEEAKEGEEIVDEYDSATAASLLSVCQATLTALVGIAQRALESSKDSTKSGANHELSTTDNDEEDEEGGVSREQQRLTRSIQRAKMMREKRTLLTWALVGGICACGGLPSSSSPSSDGRHPPSHEESTAAATATVTPGAMSEPAAQLLKVSPEP